MFSTEFGKFDGDSWEDFCQRCFKLKYESERYQEMPADTKGDLGIEGFTSTGKVFQCYCPDNDLPTKELHENQRKKINDDLKKIEKNCAELGKYLNGVQIKEWIFITPSYRNRELVRYCKDKTNAYKSKNLPIIDNDFEVLVHNSGFFTKEAPIVLDSINVPIDIEAKKVFSEEEIVEWQRENIDLTNNALTKLEKVVKGSVDSRKDRVNKVVTVAVKEYLSGNEVLENWRKIFPEKYESFLRLIDRFETNLVEECALHDGDNKVLYRKVQQELKNTIDRELPKLGFNMRGSIGSKVFYGWILECPLDFE